MSKIIDLTGQKFGRLTVVSQADKSPGGKNRWYCECDCGNTTIVINSNLTIGNTASCGCLRTETTKKRSTTHGLTKSPEYISWQRMKSRCFNPRNNRFRIYGGRGITVCDRWRAFDNFLYDMGEKPTPNHSLERHNTNGNYSPCNVYWATKVTQANNTRRNRFVKYNGETLTCAQWGKRLGGNNSFVATRLFNGWSEKDAVTIPPNKTR